MSFPPVAVGSELLAKRLIEKGQHRDELQTIVRTNDHVKLERVIQEQCCSRARRDVLADALFFSCWEGSVTLVQYLLQTECADPNVPPDQLNGGMPPLVVAVERTRGNIAGARQHQADGRTYDEDGKLSGGSQTAQSDWVPQVPAHVRLEVVKVLLKYNASRDVASPDGKPALHYATEVEVAKTLLERLDPNQKKRLLDARDRNGNDALLNSLNRLSSAALANYFVENGADTQTHDFRGRNALMSAVWRNNLPLVKQLAMDAELARGYDANRRTIWHHLAHDRAPVWDDKVVDILEKTSKAVLNEVDDKGRTCLHWNAIIGCELLTNRLLCMSATNVEARESQLQRTALHLAAQCGRIGVVKLLIKQGADIFARASDGTTPLHMACTNSAEIVRLLLDKGAEKDGRREDGQTPLHVAASHGQTAVVEILLNARCSVDVVCEGDWTPLHLACGQTLAKRHQISFMDENVATEVRRKDHLGVVKALLAAVRDVNRKSTTGKTIVHLAAESGTTEILELLLRTDNVHVGVSDMQGYTPVLHAASSQRPELVQALAPWSARHTKTLDPDAARAAKEYDATIVDFDGDTGRSTHSCVVPVYDMLYADPISTDGSRVGSHSTKPLTSRPGNFRWIHLPANDVSWCRALLTKRFIEEGAVDVQGFKALERSFKQQQNFGQTLHGRHMKPKFQRVQHSASLEQRTDGQNENDKRVLATPADMPQRPTSLSQNAPFQASKAAHLAQHRHSSSVTHSQSPQGAHVWSHPAWDEIPRELTPVSHGQPQVRKSL
jgi:ankyrin repeat protein